MGLFSNAMGWIFDAFFYFLMDYELIKAKNEFKANFVKYVKIGEISLWAFLTCFSMYIIYKKTGKIWYESKEDDNS